MNVNFLQDVQCSPGDPTRVSMEVTNSVVSWFTMYNLFRGRIQPTYKGVKESIDPKYRQDIPAGNASPNI